MSVDTFVAQPENDYSKTLLIVDKYSQMVQNNVNLVKSDISEDYDGICNLESLINFNKSLDNLAIILNKIPSFRHEFHCVMSVRRISEFILTDDNFTYGCFDFLLNSVNQLIDIIEFKLNNVSKMDSSSCKKEYRKLSREFLKSEKFFYTKVYEPSGSHDKEFFEDMLRLLAR